MTTAAPWSTSSSVSTVSMPRSWSSRDDALVVDDLAEGMRRLAGGRGLLGLVDRLADAVAEAGALGDADAPGRFPCARLSHGVPVRTPRRAVRSLGRSAPRWRAGSSAAMRRMMRSVASALGGPAVDAGRQVVGEAERLADAHRDAAARMRAASGPAARRRCEPEMPIGTIGAPVRRASTATPSRASWSAPSGSACPRGRRTGRGPRRGSAWPAGTPRRRPRRGRPGGRRRCAPSSRRPASRTAPSCRASGSAGRASASATRRAPTGSKFEAWLEARITGPSRGIASIAPSMRTRDMPRAKIRAPKATVAISGVDRAFEPGRVVDGGSLRRRLDRRRRSVPDPVIGVPPRRGSRRRPQRPCPRSGCRRSR